MSRRPLVAIVLAVGMIFAAACGSSGSSNSSPTTAASSGNTPTTVVQTLGQGVTNDTIKIGVSLVDFSCIRQFTDSIRENQDQNYNAYINNINQHGGIAGRKIVPVYHTFCPIGNTQALTLCTKFAEDDKVFAVVGNFVDFSGDAQTCLAKTHKVPLITFQLTYAIMNESPPGLILLPGTAPERTDKVLIELLDKQGTLKGKKVAILGETTSEKVVKSAVEPGLKAAGVDLGTTAILNITGSDTTAAQAQLDSFIERWKSEDVNAIFVSGTQVSSQQFIEKVRAEMPGVLLMTDITDTLSYGQQETIAGKKPNPYEGMLTAVGPTAHEYDQSANWKYCADIYKQETGKTAPNAEAVIKTSDGKKLDTYGSINDACQIMSMFQDIGNKIGKYLNVPNWQQVVDNYGPIVNRGGGQYASLTKGKYDIDDTFRLAAFDSTIPPTGNWKPLTPLQNITG